MGKLSLTNSIILKFGRFISKSGGRPRRTYFCDFNQIKNDIKPCDVILVESRSRVSRIIHYITQSQWTHAALYIGKASDIVDPKLREIVIQHSKNFSSDQLLIESIIGKGTIVSPINEYKNEHIRVLRPTGLLPEDAQVVIAYAINQIGKQYSVRHLLDLARFIFPWGIFPRTWASSLFQHNMLQPTKDICSSMVAEAFQAVNFPILPVVVTEKEKRYELIHRNPLLYTPSDFDCSPYFNVIKYPIFPLGKNMTYRDLPWKKGLISDDIKIVKIKKKEVKDTRNKDGSNHNT
jgi:hypothetical protein